MGLFDVFKISDVVITLHQPVIFPGMLMSGTMSFKTSSEVSMRAIRIKLSGRERTHIEETSGSGKNSRTSHYHGNTIVHKQLFTVSGDAKLRPSKQDTKLPIGIYCIPFEFFIPPGLPASGHVAVGSQYAKIDYHIKGYVDIPFGRDASAKVPLVVATAMPIGQYHTRTPTGIREPLVVPVSCCCCISKGTVKFSVSADKSIVVLDRADNIKLDIFIDNSSGEEPINAATLTLRNLTTFRASGHTRVSANVAATHRVPLKILPKTSQTVDAVLPIQPGVCQQLPPSMKGYLIDSAWQVGIELDIPYATDPLIAFPMVVAPRLDETNLAPPLSWTSTTYPQLQKGQEPEYAWVPPPRLLNMCVGVDLLPRVTGTHLPAPYAAPPVPLQQPASIY